MAAGRLAEGSLQDPPLQRIGVLEFIDQGSAVAAGHGLQQRRGRRGVGAGIELLQQLPEAHLAAAFPPPGQFAAAPVGEVEQQQLRRPVHQRCDRLQQGALRQRHARAMGRGGHFAEGAGMEIALQFLLLQHLLVARCPRLRWPCIDPGLHPLQLVGLGFEPVGAVVEPQALEFGGGGRQLGFQVLGALLPLLQKGFPALLPELLQLLSQRGFSVQLRRQGIEAQGRVPVEAGQQFHQAIGTDLALPQPREQAGGEGQHLLAPVVVHQLRAPLPRLALQGHGGPEACLQRLALQRAPAEAVDRGDVGAIELLERQQQSSPQGGGWFRAPGGAPLGQRFIRAGGIALGVEQVQRLLQAPGDPVAQFGRGGLGEGHHQQLFHLERLLAFAQQAQHQMGQGEGFARACTGFQQADARAEGHRVGFEGRQQGFGHRLTSWRRSSSGVCSSRASA